MRLFVSITLALSLCGCDRPPAELSAPTGDRIFESLDAAGSGLDFMHINGMSGRRYLLEIMGAGAALLDYDNDGDLDIYLVQGGALEGHPASGDASAKGESEDTDRLFRNDLGTGGGLHFTDVTKTSGIKARGYGMGVATGDFDADGWTDIYVTNFGPNQLWRNKGDGTFVDVTATAGVAGGARWSSSAAFLDFDADGLLDLFVTNYLDYSLHNPKLCRAANSVPDYCGPQSYPPVPDQLYRNLGHGRFAEVSVQAGLAGTSGKGLGVITRDFNRDGHIDVFVANDTMDNFLWYNNGDGSFTEQGLESGVAVNMDGEREASMGVSAADFDADGDLDLFMTHLQGETNTLYVNDGSTGFVDSTNRLGLGAPSRKFTGFGTAWLDYDNDGWQDLLIANGAVRTEGVQSTTDPLAPLREPNQLFRCLGEGRFADVTRSAGDAFEQLEVSRGAAFGDLDNDGRSDVVITNNNGPVRVLMNRAARHNHWLGLELRDAETGRDIPGVRIAVLTGQAAQGSRVHWRWTGTDGSYLSANDPRVLLGLGTQTQIEAVRVYWPQGTVEEWRDLPVDRYHPLVRGSGSEIEADAH